MHSVSTSVQPVIFIISGPSGVGKDTVMRELEKFSLPLQRVTTTTSRPMRPGEREGVPYHFVSEQQFQQMIARGEFAEHARVFNSWKGITKAELEKVLDGNHGVLLQIEHQGAKTIKRLYPEAVVFVITPPSIAALNQRLTQRGDKQAEELQKRLAQNEHWQADYAEFEHFIENPDNHPEQAAKQIAQLITQQLGLT